MRRATLLLVLPILAVALAAVQDRGRADDRMTEADLGRMLFFDTGFSVRGGMACATCHDPGAGFVDRRENAGGGIVSLGDDGHSLGVRNAPTASYADSVPAFHFDRKSGEYVGGLFLDGRAATLAAQATQPPLNPSEMALPDAATLVARIKADPTYRDAFRQLYGPDIFIRRENGAPAAYAAFGRAIAAYERDGEFSTYDSKYDRFLKGEYDLTVLEDLGRTLFFSNNNVNCASCHSLKPEDSPHEPFTNHQYRNIGVPRNPALLAMGQVRPGYIDHGLLENPAVSDPEYDGKFRNPTLRNVAVTGPYMHNGVFRDLRTVIAFYDHYNNPARALNPETGKPWAAPEVPATVDRKDLRAQPLSDRKIDALVAFLETLTHKRYEPLLEEQRRARKAPEAQSGGRTAHKAGGD